MNRKCQSYRIDKPRSPAAARSLMRGKIILPLIVCERDFLSQQTSLLNVAYTRAAERKSIADKNSSRVCF